MSEPDEQMMQRIARRHGVDVVFADEHLIKLNGRDAYENASFSSGNVHTSDKRWPPRIEIGIYADAELRLLSFFHELGHCLDSTRPWHTSKLDQERAAWEIAYSLATSHGVESSAEARDWASAQLETYNTPEWSCHA